MLTHQTPIDSNLIRQHGAQLCWQQNVTILGGYLPDATNEVWMMMGLEPRFAGSKSCILTTEPRLLLKVLDFQLANLTLIALDRK